MALNDAGGINSDPRLSPVEGIAPPQGNAPTPEEFQPVLQDYSIPEPMNAPDIPDPLDSPYPAGFDPNEGTEDMTDAAKRWINGTPEPQPGDPDYSQPLAPARRPITDTNQEILSLEDIQAKAKHPGVLGTIAEELLTAKGAFQKIPWFGQLPAATEVIQVWRAYSRLKNNPTDYTDKQREEDFTRAVKFRNESAITAETERNRSTWGQAIALPLRSLPFAGEIILSNLIGRRLGLAPTTIQKAAAAAAGEKLPQQVEMGVIRKKLTLGLDKALGDAGTKMISERMQAYSAQHGVDLAWKELQAGGAALRRQFLREAQEGVIGNIAARNRGLAVNALGAIETDVAKKLMEDNLGLRIATRSLEVAAQLPLMATGKLLSAGPGRQLARTNMTQEPDGTLKFTDSGETMKESVLKGITQEYFEYLSEYSGGLIQQSAKSVLSKGALRHLTTFKLADLANQLPGKGLLADKVKMVMKSPTLARGFRTMERLMGVAGRRAAVYDPLSETGEEWINNIGVSVFDLDDDGVTPWSTRVVNSLLGPVAQPKQFGIMMLGFSMFPAAGFAAGTVAGRLSSEDIEANARTLKSVLDPEPGKIPVWRDRAQLDQGTQMLYDKLRAEDVSGDNTSLLGKMIARVFPSQARLAIRPGSLLQMTTDTFKGLEDAKKFREKLLGATTPVEQEMAVNVLRNLIAINTDTVVVEGLAGKSVEERDGFALITGLAQSQRQFRDTLLKSGYGNFLPTAAGSLINPEAGQDIVTIEKTRSSDAELASTGAAWKSSNAAVSIPRLMAYIRTGEAALKENKLDPAARPELVRMVDEYKRTLISLNTSPEVNRILQQHLNVYSTQADITKNALAKTGAFSGSERLTLDMVARQEKYPVMQQWKKAGNLSELVTPLRQILSSKASSAKRDIHFLPFMGVEETSQAFRNSGYDTEMLTKFESGQKVVFGFRVPTTDTSKEQIFISEKTTAYDLIHELAHTESVAEPAVRAVAGALLLQNRRLQKDSNLPGLSEKVLEYVRKYLPSLNTVLSRTDAAKYLGRIARGEMPVSEKFKEDVAAMVAFHMGYTDGNKRRELDSAHVLYDALKGHEWLTHGLEVAIRADPALSIPLLHKQGLTQPEFAALVSKVNKGKKLPPEGTAGSSTSPGGQRGPAGHADSDALEAYFLEQALNTPEVYPDDGGQPLVDDDKQPPVDDGEVLRPPGTRVPPSKKPPVPRAQHPDIIAAAEERATRNREITENLAKIQAEQKRKLEELSSDPAASEKSAAVVKKPARTLAERRKAVKAPDEPHSNLSAAAQPQEEAKKAPRHTQGDVFHVARLLNIFSPTTDWRTTKEGVDWDHVNDELEEKGFFGKHLTEPLRDALEYLERNHSKLAVSILNEPAENWREKLAEAMSPKKREVPEPPPVAMEKVTRLPGESQYDFRGREMEAAVRMDTQREIQQYEYDNEVDATEREYVEASQADLYAFAEDRNTKILYRILRPLYRNMDLTYGVGEEFQNQGIRTTTFFLHHNIGGIKPVTKLLQAAFRSTDGFKEAIADPGGFFDRLIGKDAKYKWARTYWVNHLSLTLGAYTYNELTSKDGGISLASALSSLDLRPRMGFTINRDGTLLLETLNSRKGPIRRATKDFLITARNFYQEDLKAEKGTLSKVWIDRINKVFGAHYFRDVGALKHAFHNREANGLSDAMVERAAVLLNNVFPVKSLGTGWEVKHLEWVLKNPSTSDSAQKAVTTFLWFLDKTTQGKGSPAKSTYFKLRETLVGGGQTYGLVDHVYTPLTLLRPLSLDPFSRVWGRRSGKVAGTIVVPSLNTPEHAAAMVDMGLLPERNPENIEVSYLDHSRAYYHAPQRSGEEQQVRKKWWDFADARQWTGDEREAIADQLLKMGLESTEELPTYYHIITPMGVKPGMPMVQVRFFDQEELKAKYAQVYDWLKKNGGVDRVVTPADFLKMNDAEGHGNIVLYSAIFHRMTAGVYSGYGSFEAMVKYGSQVMGNGPSILPTEGVPDQVGVLRIASIPSAIVPSGTEAPNPRSKVKQQLMKRFDGMNILTKAGALAYGVLKEGAFKGLHTGLDVNHLRSLTKSFSVLLTKESLPDAHPALLELVDWVDEYNEAHPDAQIFEIAVQDNVKVPKVEGKFPAAIIWKNGELFFDEAALSGVVPHFVPTEQVHVVASLSAPVEPDLQTAALQLRESTTLRDMPLIEKILNQMTLQNWKDLPTFRGSLKKLAETLKGMMRVGKEDEDLQLLIALEKGEDVRRTPGVMERLEQTLSSAMRRAQAKLFGVRNQAIPDLLSRKDKPMQVGQMVNAKGEVKSVAQMRRMASKALAALRVRPAQLFANIEGVRPQARMGAYFSSEIADPVEAVTTHLWRNKGLYWDVFESTVVKVDGKNVVKLERKLLPDIIADLKIKITQEKAGDWKYEFTLPGGYVIDNRTPTSGSESTTLYRFVRKLGPGERSNISSKDGRISFYAGEDYDGDWRLTYLTALDEQGIPISHTPGLVDDDLIHLDLPEGQTWTAKKAASLSFILLARGMSHPAEAAEGETSKYFNPEAGVDPLSRELDAAQFEPLTLPLREEYKRRTKSGWNNLDAFYLGLRAPGDASALGVAVVQRKTLQFLLDNPGLLPADKLSFTLGGQVFEYGGENNFSDEQQHLLRSVSGDMTGLVADALKDYQAPSLNMTQDFLGLIFTVLMSNTKLEYKLKAAGDTTDAQLLKSITGTFEFMLKHLFTPEMKNLLREQGFSNAKIYRVKKRVLGKDDQLFKELTDLFAITESNRTLGSWLDTGKNLDGDRAERFLTPFKGTRFIYPIDALKENPRIKQGRRAVATFFNHLPPKVKFPSPKVLATEVLARGSSVERYEELLDEVLLIPDNLFSEQLVAENVNGEPGKPELAYVARDEKKNSAFVASLARWFFKFTEEQQHALTIRAWELVQSDEVVGQKSFIELLPPEARVWMQKQIDILHPEIAKAYLSESEEAPGVPTAAATPSPTGEVKTLKGIVEAPTTEAPKAQFSLAAADVNEQGEVTLEFSRFHDMLGDAKLMRLMATRQITLDQALARAQVSKDEATLLRDYAKTTGEKDFTKLVAGLESSVLQKLTIVEPRAGYEPEDLVGPMIPAEGSAPQYERLSVNQGQGTYGEYFIKVPFPVPGQHGTFQDPKLAGWFRGRLMPDGRFEVNEVQSELFQKNKGGFLTRQQILQADFDKLRRQTSTDITDDQVWEDVIGQDDVRDTYRAEMYERYESLSKENFFEKNQAGFLNLLAKDQNWVPVFVQAIKGWAEKQGYSAVRFPTGETAAKVEGHPVLADQLTALQKEREYAPSSVEASSLPASFTIGGKSYERGIEGWTRAMLNPDGSTQVAQPIPADVALSVYLGSHAPVRTKAVVEQDIQHYKTQGIEKLAPIEAFYENRIRAIVDRMGAKPVTDAGGNTWREVALTPAVPKQIKDLRSSLHLQEKPVDPALDHVPSLQFSLGEHQMLDDIGGGLDPMSAWHREMRDRFSFVERSVSMAALDIFRLKKAAGFGKHGVPILNALSYYINAGLGEKGMKARVRTKENVELLVSLDAEGELVTKFSDEKAPMVEDIVKQYNELRAKSPKLQLASFDELAKMAPGTLKRALDENNRHAAAFSDLPRLYEELPNYIPNVTMSPFGKDLPQQIREMLTTLLEDGNSKLQFVIHPESTNALVASRAMSSNPDVIASHLTTYLSKMTPVERRAAIDKMLRQLDAKWKSMNVAAPSTITASTDRNKYREMTLDEHFEENGRVLALPDFAQAAEAYVKREADHVASVRIMSYMANMTDFSGISAVFLMKRSDVPVTEQKLLSNTTLRNMFNNWQRRLKNDGVKAENYDPSIDVWANLAKLHTLAASGWFEDNGYEQVQLKHVPQFDHAWVLKGVSRKLLDHVVSRGIDDWDDTGFQGVAKWAAKKILWFNQFTKQLALSLSLFHFATLMESHISAYGITGRNPIANPIRFFREIRDIYKTHKGVISNPAQREMLAGWMSDGMSFRFQDRDDMNMGARGEQGPVDQILNKMVDSLDKHPTTKYSLGVGAKFARALKREGDHLLWEVFQPAAKIMLAEHTLNDILMNPDYREIISTPAGLRQVRAEIAQMTNQSFGGLEWREMLWATPLMRDLLRLTVFAPDWTFANIQMAMIPDMLQKFTGVPMPFAPTAKYDIRTKQLLEKNWPAFIYITLVAIPIVWQAAIYGAFGDPDKGDKPFMWMNEEGKRWWIDTTPISRKIMGGKLFGKTERRRSYMQWGKSGWEVLGWFEDPLKTFLGKTSLGAKVLWEQITSRSTSGRSMPWAEDGTQGPLDGLLMVNGKFMESRLGYIAQKFFPMTLLTVISADRPSAFFAPASLGMSSFAAEKVIAEVLMAYGTESVWHQISSNPDRVRRLETLVQSTLEAAWLNGYDPNDIMTTAKAMVHAKLLNQYYFPALEKHPTHPDKAKLEEISRIEIRTGTAFRNLQQSVGNLYKKRGRLMTERQREAMSETWAAAAQKIQDESE